MELYGHTCLRLLGLLLLLHHALASTSTPSESTITEQTSPDSPTSGSTHEPTTMTTTTIKTTTTEGSTKPKPLKTKFSTNDWLVVGAASAIPVVVFVATIILGICRVKQEQNELKKKMSKMESEGQDNLGFQM